MADCRVLLRGGGVVEGVYWSTEDWKRAREVRAKGATDVTRNTYVRLLWDPGHTLHDRESFSVTLLVDEIIGVQETGD